MGNISRLHHRMHLVDPNAVRLKLNGPSGADEAVPPVEAPEESQAKTLDQLEKDLKKFSIPFNPYRDTWCDNLLATAITGFIAAGAGFLLMTMTEKKTDGAIFLGGGVAIGGGSWIVRSSQNCP